MSLKNIGQLIGAILIIVLGVAFIMCSGQQERGEKCTMFENIMGWVYIVVGGVAILFTGYEYFRNRGMGGYGGYY